VQVVYPGQHRERLRPHPVAGEFTVHASPSNCGPIAGRSAKTALRSYIGQTERTSCHSRSAANSRRVNRQAGRRLGKPESS
jgi:hypothetical protein